MPQLGRAGLVSRPNALAVVVVGLAVAALFLTGRWLNADDGGRRPATGAAGTGAAGTQAPARVGGRVECPPRWPVLAASDHASYPPGRPGRPPAGATAVACYQTAAQAASAGYPPALPPAGVREVGGVYLAPTGSGFRARCRRAADRLGFAVPCPPPAAHPGARRPAGAAVRAALRLPARAAAAVPVGRVPGPGRLPRPIRVRHPGHRRRPATRRRPAGAAVLRRAPGRHAHRAAGSGGAGGLRRRRSAVGLGGSMLLRWSQRGTLTVVTVSGWSELNRRLLVEVAARLRLVGPARAAMAPGHHPAASQHLLLGFADGQRVLLLDWRQGQPLAGGGFRSGGGGDPICPSDALQAQVPW